jgi:predicted glycoside hydrolase/deacetylase ChbG (UPF0249 family)
MKRVIVNADDFGFSKRINSGIIETYRKGILTSASLVVNMPGFDDAINLIRQNPGLDIGVHINIIRGRPISSLTNSRILTEQGYFLMSIPRLLTRIFTKKIRLEELEVECRAQIEKAFKEGISISHIDSEKHLHLFRPFFKLIVKLADEYGIKKIRLINEIPYIFQKIPDFTRFFNKQLYKSVALSIISTMNKPLVKASNMRAPNYSYGIAGAGNMAIDGYKNILKKLKNGTTEIICHPGYAEDGSRKNSLCESKYCIDKIREQELGALLEPRIKEALGKLNVELIAYKEL